MTTTSFVTGSRDYDLEDSTPAAPTGRLNVKFQTDGGIPRKKISGHVPNLGKVDARTGTSETIGLADQGKLVTITNASAIAVTLNSSAVADGFVCALDNLGAGLATLTPSSGTINGAATLAVASGGGAWLFFDGTNWKAVLSRAPGSGVSQTAGITIDGGSATPTTGSKGFLQIPFAATITRWALIADAAGSCSIDIKKCSNAGFPTTSSIVASAPPNLSTQQKNSSSTLTGWTTAIAADDILEFVVSSASTITRVILELSITRT